MTIDIFAPGVGQYDNIGDIILRRQLLDWVRPLGRLHVYIGPAPDGYAAGLKLTPDDIVYESFARWYLAGLRSAIAGRARYVFKPGEIQLTIIGMKEHVGMLPLLAVLRMRRGRAVRVGVGARNFAPVPRLLMGPSISLSVVTAWRDAKTTEYFGRGVTMPDLAFGEGDSDPSADAGRTRDTLIVEMRSDRPYPSAAWLSAVRGIAAANGWSIAVVTQVLRDSERSKRLAHDLDGRFLDWDGRGHAEQEQKLRDVYARCALAVSDRLHVLVSAYTEGAVPVAALSDSSDKIARHFDAANVTGVAFPASGLTEAEITASIEGVLARRAEIMGALSGTRAELERVRQSVIRALGVTVGESRRVAAPRG